MPLDDRSHYSVQDRPVDIAVHLDRALVHIMRADELRLGPNRDLSLERAADHLEQAGYPALAADVLDACGFGGDLRSVETAIRGLLR